MSAEEANRMRWEFQRRHYEVWYATLTHRQTRTGFWIRYTLESPTEGHGEPYAQLWFARFDPRPERTFGINKKFPVDELRAEAAPFRLTIDRSVLTSSSMTGRLAGDGHEAEWDLRWTPSARVHQHLPSPIYKARFAETVVHSPSLDVRAAGTIRVDGEEYVLDGEPLGQTHIWGKKHAYSWAWSHCNAFDGQPGALETLSVRLRRGAIVLPKLTLLSLYLDGADPAELHFRELWQLPLARSEYGTGRYHLAASNAEFKVEAELTCRPEDMIMAEYVDPDGEPAYCHNTEHADATVRVFRRSPFVGRFREWKTLTSRGGAHFEWAARAGDPLVRKRHVLV